MRTLGIIVTLGALLGCGSEVVLSSPAAGGGGAGGSGGAAVVSVSVSGSGGDGGARVVPECDGRSFVRVALHDMEFLEVCDWGSDVTDGPVAYNVLLGTANPTGIVEACGGEDPDPESAFRIELPAQPLAPGSYGSDMQVGIYWSGPASNVVTIDEVDPVGGRVSGSFSATLFQLDQDIDTTGVFCAQRVVDMAAAP